MATDLPNELAEFHQFIAVQLANGELISPEEALDLWRIQNPSDEQYAEDVAAVQEALDEMAAGKKCIPWEEVKGKFCARHRIPRVP